MVEGKFLEGRWCLVVDNAHHSTLSNIQLATINIQFSIPS